MASGIAIHKSIIVERGGQYDTNADKTDPNINNPWKWSWLEFVTKTGDRLSESFRKITKPGFVLCIVCPSVA